MMNWTVTGAGLGFLGVAAGAFAAHALRDALPADRLEIFETAVRYQMYHALALLLASWSGASKAAWALFAGTLIFSGSLYLLVLTGWRWMGMVTPLGGVLLLVGWILLAISGKRVAGYR